MHLDIIFIGGLNLHWILSVEFPIELMLFPFDVGRNTKTSIFLFFFK